MSNGEESQEPKTQIPISEYIDNQKIKVIKESKEEIISWARNRFSIITIVIAVLGLVGTNVLTATVIRGFIERDIKKAEYAAISAEINSKIAQDKMGKAVEQATDYSKSVKGLKEDADNIQKSYTKLKDELKAERENVRADANLKIAQLNLQIMNLDARINILAETSKILTTETGEILVAKTDNNVEQKVRERFKELQTAQTTLKKDAITKQEEFEENSLFSIKIISEKYPPNLISCP